MLAAIPINEIITLFGFLTVFSVNPRFMFRTVDHLFQFLQTVMIWFEDCHWLASSKIP